MVLELTQRFKYRGQDVAWGSMGAGEPLVVIHGTPFSSQVWRKIVPLLARRYKVYFFDLIGYGNSEKKDGQDVSLGVQNGLLAALLQTWNISEPEVLCHDFGGTTALRAYFLDNIRFKHLTIMDPVAMAPWGSPFVQHVRTYEAAFAELPPYAHDALLKAYLQTAAANPLSDEAFDVYMEPWQGEIGQPAFYRQIAQMDQRYTDEIEPLYEPMDCPVRLLWGKEDKWIPISQGQKLAERISGGTLTPIQNAGHLVQEDAPEAIIAAMFQR